MSVEDVVLVATVREEIRGGALQVDVADVPCHIEAAQAVKLNRPVDKIVYWDKPMIGTGKGSEIGRASCRERVSSPV